MKSLHCERGIYWITFSIGTPLSSCERMNPIRRCSRTFFEIQTALLSNITIVNRFSRYDSCYQGRSKLSKSGWGQRWIQRGAKGTRALVRFYIPNLLIIEIIGFCLTTSLHKSNFHANYPHHTHHAKNWSVEPLSDFCLDPSLVGGTCI